MLNSIEISERFKDARGDAIFVPRNIKRQIEETPSVEKLRRIMSEYGFLSGYENRTKYAVELGGSLSGSSELGVVCGDDWSIYVFNKVLDISFHGLGDVLVLVDEKTKNAAGGKQHIAFFGESMKGPLNRGVAGYNLFVDGDVSNKELEEGVVSKAVEEMMAPCLNAFDLMQEGGGSGKSPYAVMDKINALTKPISAEEFVAAAKELQLISVLGSYGMKQAVSSAQKTGVEQKRLNKILIPSKLFGEEFKLEEMQQREAALCVKMSAGAAAQALLENNKIEARKEYSCPAIPDAKIRFYGDGAAVVSFANKESKAKFAAECHL